MFKEMFKESNNEVKMTRGESGLIVEAISDKKVKSILNVLLSQKFDDFYKGNLLTYIEGGSFFKLGEEEILKEIKDLFNRK